MNSHKNELVLSILLTLCGAGGGLRLGSTIGEYMDAQALASVGRRGLSYHYWDIRLGICGFVLGIIAGAIAGYLVALFDKRK